MIVQQWNPVFESYEWVDDQAQAKSLAAQKQADLGLGYTKSGPYGVLEFVPYTQTQLEALQYGVPLKYQSASATDSEAAQWSDVDPTKLAQEVAWAKSRANALTDQYANAGAGRWNAMTQQDLQGAQDWAKQTILGNLGIGQSPSADNYKGWKPVSDISNLLTPASYIDDPSNPDPFGLEKIKAKELAKYNADPEDYIAGKMNQIHGWNVGGDNNQQYTFNPKTGQLMNVWTHNTEDNQIPLVLTLAALGGGALLSGAGAVGAAGADAGIGMATIGGQSVTPALMESAMGSAGYGLSSASGLLGAGVGTAAALGDPTVSGYADVNAIQPDLRITNSTLADSAAGSPGYGASSVGPGGPADLSLQQQLQQWYDSASKLKDATKPYTDAYNQLKTVNKLLNPTTAKTPTGTGTGTGTGGSGSGTDMTALLALLAAGQGQQQAPVQTPLTEIKSYVDPFGSTINASSGGSLDDLVRLVRR